VAPLFSISILWPLFRRFHLQYVLFGAALSAIGRGRLQRETEPVCTHDFIWNWNDLYADTISAESQLFGIGFDVYDDLCVGEKERRCEDEHVWGHFVYSTLFALGYARIWLFGW
jgi:hypothetical protein